MSLGLDHALLEPMTVGSIRGDFYVPAYQRGYRWGTHEVQRLLEDIWENLDSGYYLQPIVVKKRGEEWELVDGQQRLTTLFLIFQYMKNAELKRSAAKFALRYETRSESAAFLTKPDQVQALQNIDFFHISQAYQTIEAWFQDPGVDEDHRAARLNIALHETVRVIWYEAPESVDSTTLFTRLNVGRIPLTDAELVKALLLSRIRENDSTRERAAEVASQWDTVERQLREPELWAFITGGAESEATHIGYLIDTLAGSGSEERSHVPFQTFESLRAGIIADPLAFWERVLDLHALLLGWYENRDLFHKVGYLTTEGTPLSTLVDAAGGKQKSAFESDLNALITESLHLSEDAVRSLTYTSASVRRALLLMNVETVRAWKHSAERYSFHEHAAKNWSLEHIHAQNAELLTREEQWRTWLELHLQALRSHSKRRTPPFEELASRIEVACAEEKLTGPEFRLLEQDVVQFLSSAGTEDDVHAVANLALLPQDDNSALSNSMFTVKRAVILQRDRDGAYIPPCTRNVFLKYYSPPQDHQLEQWSNTDRRHYLEALVDSLRPYLTTGKDVA